MGVNEIKHHNLQILFEKIPLELVVLGWGFSDDRRKKRFNGFRNFGYFSQLTISCIFIEPSFIMYPESSLKSLLVNSSRLRRNAATVL